MLAMIAAAVATDAPVGVDLALWGCGVACGWVASAVAERLMRRE